MAVPGQFPHAGHANPTLIILPVIRTYQDSFARTFEAASLLDYKLTSKVQIRLSDLPMRGVTGGMARYGYVSDVSPEHGFHPPCSVSCLIADGKCAVPCPSFHHFRCLSFTHALNMCQRVTHKQSGPYMPKP